MITVNPDVTNIDKSCHPRKCHSCNYCWTGSDPDLKLTPFSESWAMKRYPFNWKRLKIDPFSRTCAGLWPKLKIRPFCLFLCFRFCRPFLLSGPQPWCSICLIFSQCFLQFLKTFLYTSYRKDILVNTQKTCAEMHVDYLIFHSQVFQARIFRPGKYLQLK